MRGTVHLILMKAYVTGNASGRGGKWSGGGWTVDEDARSDEDACAYRDAGAKTKSPKLEPPNFSD